MGEREVPLHYVCTRDEAGELIRTNDRFWISNCGCREARGKCERSRIDVCLQFVEVTAADLSGLRVATREEAEGILKEAEAKHLVSRPFRDEHTKTRTEGICFCCDDCCGYFTDPGDYDCEKGRLIEQTDMEKCTDCGLCADVCYFGARKMEGGRLVVRRVRCYGCALCLDVCPEDCIRMVERPVAEQ
jgi:ferredoxin